MIERLHHMIEAAAEADAGAPYLHFRGQTLSYGQVVERSRQLARALAGLGIRTGDRVAVMLTNRPEIVLCYYACWKLGAIMVPLNTRYQRREAAHALEHSGADAFLCEARFFPIVEPLCRKDQLHDHTVLIDGKANGLTEFPDWEDFLAGAPEAIDWPEFGAEAGATINYTSGSTAMPKGVLHSHATLLAMTRNMARMVDHPDLRTGVAYLPMCYIAALLFQIMYAAWGRRDFVIVPNKEVDILLDTIDQHGATDIVMLPTDMIHVVEHPKAQEIDWSSLRYVCCGGDKVPPDVQNAFKKLSGFEVTEGYGMTEIGMVISNPPYGPKKLGTMGRSYGDVEAELRDEQGRPVPDGERGDLWVRTSACMVGYWNNPQATAETIVDGWLKTGDLCTRDADGYYTFVGRSKLIIVRGGSNIAPQEVEEVIDHHPAVSSCCVVGKPDPRWGEIVVAFVVTHGYPGPTPGEDDIITYARQRLAHYKCPERVIFLDKMPYNFTGKMDRKGLKERAEAL